MNKITALLDAITEVIKNIGTLTESLQTVSNLLNEIKNTEISKKSTVHTSESSVKSETVKSKVYFLEDVRSVLAKKSQSGLTSEVREIIVKYGGNKLSEIAPAITKKSSKMRRHFRMSNHAFLSPSSSHRWLNCTPSAVLESKFENKSTKASEEGTVAHAWCEHKLKTILRRRSDEPISHYTNNEMQEYTDLYVDFVLEQFNLAKQKCKDPLILIEQKVDFSEYVPNGFGTADCIIVSESKIHIIDFKYGMGVLVDAFDNPQMKCYALGALKIFDRLYDIKDVSMSIFQPRRDNVSTWTVSADELKGWAENVLKPKAELAVKGEGDYCVGDWCTFCKASVRCRARAENNLKLAQEEFRLPPLLTDSEIENILSVIPNLTKWANEIMAYATESAVNHGKHWNGFKIVEGRSVRKYKDETAVAKALEDAGYKDIYRKSLITLTEMQKLLGKQNFNEILGNLIIKPKGKPTLVPETDKREAMTITDVKNEFITED